MADAELTTPVQRRGVFPSARHAREVVHALLLPLAGIDAVLPNTAVAEVVGHREAEPLADAPAWLLGSVEWRERRIPLISLEAAWDGEPARPSPRSRMAVLNTLSGNPELPYIGVLTQGIPQLRLLAADALEAAPEEAEGRASVAAAVRLAGGLALIPDIDELERRVLKLRRG